ncbi:uncharacterized protein ACOB8E_014399 isoform 1-T1 [Sarcophilus harrisii]
MEQAFGGRLLAFYRSLLNMMGGRGPRGGWLPNQGKLEEGVWMASWQQLILRTSLSFTAMVKRGKGVPAQQPDNAFLPVSTSIRSTALAGAHFGESTASEGAPPRREHTLEGAPPWREHTLEGAHLGGSAASEGAPPRWEHRLGGSTASEGASPRREHRLGGSTTLAGAHLGGSAASEGAPPRWECRLRGSAASEGAHLGGSTTLAGAYFGGSTPWRERHLGGSTASVGAPPRREHHLRESPSQDVAPGPGPSVSCGSLLPALLGIGHESGTLSSHVHHLTAISFSLRTSALKTRQRDFVPFSLPSPGICPLMASPSTDWTRRPTQLCSSRLSLV